MELWTSGMEKTLILPELDWNVAEDWWLNGGGSLSGGAPEAGKSEFGSLPDQFTLSLRHYR